MYGTAFPRGETGNDYHIITLMPFREWYKSIQRSEHIIVRVVVKGDFYLRRTGEAGEIRGL